MAITVEEALKKHREMWEAMQRELGDNPSGGERADFKRDWCLTHSEYLTYDCYLCQYVSEVKRGGDSHIRSIDCEAFCPINWGYDEDYKRSDCVFGATNYLGSPISAILALPERVVSAEGK